MHIGFIGQGFVGKSYADDFEKRGYDIVRFSLDPAFAGNREKIAECDFVLIAVPTPTTPEGFDPSIIESVLPLVGKGKTAVIKSTLLPGTTERLQKQFPDITILFSPEFLSEVTAAEDAAHPIMNIAGYVTDATQAKAEELLSILPESPYQKTMRAVEAEMVKYAHNIQGYVRIVYANLLYDLSQKLGADFEMIAEAMDHDPMLSPYYNHPVHKGGRGAGGNCFVKDFAAFRKLYAEVNPDPLAMNILNALEAKNLALLKATNKSQDLVRGVYGDEQKAA